MIRPEFTTTKTRGIKRGLARERPVFDCFERPEFFFRLVREKLKKRQRSFTPKTVGRSSKAGVSKIGLYEAFVRKSVRFFGTEANVACPVQRKKSTRVLAKIRTDGGETQCPGGFDRFFPPSHRNS